MTRELTENEKLVLEAFRQKYSISTLTVIMAQQIMYDGHLVELDVTLPPALESKKVLCMITYHGDYIKFAILSDIQ